MAENLNYESEYELSEKSTVIRGVSQVQNSSFEYASWIKICFA